MKPASFWDWLGPLTLMAVFIAYLHLSTSSEIVLCRGDANCFREWLSALSGWVAAAGALFAAMWTVGPLRQQVREAQRQTDFLLGDAEPEFVLLRQQNQGEVVLRITNWNRRNVIVNRVRCVEPDDMEVSNVLDSEDENLETKRSKIRNKIAYRIDGWHDRSKAPERRWLVIVFSRNGQIDPTVATSRIGISVEVSYRIVGQIHERRSSIATAMDLADD